MIQRPFVVTQPIPAISGNSTVTMHHENGGIVLEVEHPMFRDSGGILLDVDKAEQVRDALDTLIDEARRGHVYAQEQM